MILKPDDAARLIAKTHSDRTVLIGGQAVSFWVKYFGLETKFPALTQDIDYLGTQAAAKFISSRLGARLKAATFDDATPISAVMLVPLDGYPEPIVVDYMASVVGLSTTDIEKSAVTVQLEDQKLKVLHPLLLLQSKIWNLYRIEGKRTPEGIEQARLSIAIAAAYVVKLNSTKRDLLNSIEKIARFAATAPALYARDHFQLNCLDAIPAAVFEEGVLPREFHEQRWPRLLKAIK